MNAGTDALGHRMKEYEAGHDTRLMPRLPAFARLDGRNFSAFTRYAAKPFSVPFRAHMIDLTAWLVTETCAQVGYTQSDEITLMWYAPEGSSATTFFDGRVQKMTSGLAAMASVQFNDQLHRRQSMSPAEYAASGLSWKRNPTFDCRAWNVPTKVEATNVFVWRQLDAARNSVQMAARHYFSHGKCHGLSCSQLQELLHTRGINWNDYALDFKRGTFVRKKREHVMRQLTAEEIAALPPKHRARQDPNLVFDRLTYTREDLWLTKITNRVDVLFHDAIPTQLEAS